MLTASQLIWGGRSLEMAQISHRREPAKEIITNDGSFKHLKVVTRGSFNI